MILSDMNLHLNRQLHRLFCYLSVVLLFLPEKMLFLFEHVQCLRKNRP